MSEKRFFVDKIDTNQYGVYDRLKIGYIKPLVYTDRTVSLDFTQSVCDLLNACDDKMKYGVTIKELFDRNKKLEEDIDNEKNDYRELFSNYIYLQEKNVKLKKENENLRQELQKMDNNDGWICGCCKHFHTGVQDRCDKDNNWVLKEGTCKNFERHRMWNW